MQRGHVDTVALLLMTHADDEGLFEVHAEFEEVGLLLWDRGTSERGLHVLLANINVKTQATRRKG